MTRLNDPIAAATHAGAVNYNIVIYTGGTLDNVIIDSRQRIIRTRIVHKKYGNISVGVFLSGCKKIKKYYS